MCGGTFFDAKSSPQCPAFSVTGDSIASFADPLVLITLHIMSSEPLFCDDDGLFCIPEC